VGHEHDRQTTRLAAWYAREDVSDVSRLRVPRADPGGLLHLRVEPESSQATENVLANASIVLAADRVRSLGDLANVSEGPFGGELGGRCGCGNRSWRLTGAPNEQRTQEERATAVPSARRGVVECIASILHPCALGATVIPLRSG
jgi:hypothetical protein